MRGHPREIVENWTLLDGSAATVRPIRSSDMDRERAFVRNLSPQSKFKRFMGELKELSVEQLYDFTHPNPEEESAYVVVRSTIAGEEQIAVARYVVNSDGSSCEFAIAIADAWQGKGIAGRLMRVLIRDARERGLDQMIGYVLGVNARMLDFVRRLGFRIEFDPDSPGVRIARLALRNEATA